MQRLWLVCAVLFVTTGMELGARGADAPPATGPRLVMIIRHAEKPDDIVDGKNPHLSARGQERAAALVNVIREHFPSPDFLIATHKSKNSDRPFETLSPLAKALHETIESAFKDDDVEPLAHELMANPKYTGKVVLIAWHHGKIPDLAKSLGATDAPAKWDSNVFDRVWEITYDHGAAKWQDVPEKALPGDAST